MKKKNSFFRTVAFRIAALYVSGLALLSFIVFATSLFVLHAILMANEKEDLEEDALVMEELYKTRGLTGLRAEFKREILSDGPNENALVLLSPEGEIRASSDLNPWQKKELLPTKTFLQKKNTLVFNTIPAPEDEYKACVIWKRFYDGTILCLAESLEEYDDILALYQNVFLVDICLLLLLGGGLGWCLSKRAMSGVLRVTKTAETIRKNNLTERVDVGKEGQEIKAMAIAFNEMLERIAKLIAEIKEVTDDIAHDLRSPLTRLRGIAEMTLTSSSTQNDYQEMASLVVEECDEVIHMINTMLEISETESGSATLHKTPIDLGKLLQNAQELFTPIAEIKHAKITLALPEQKLIIIGDESRLQRVISNLLDNALKHIQDGGQVTLSVKSEQDRVCITVKDNGIGICPKDIPHVFNRFYRADTSRSEPGNGLGLSLCQSIIRAHAGEITVKSSPETGSTFTVHLPVK